MPDLVSGYAVDRNQVFDKNPVSNGGGILTLHRGNVDSIYPNTPEAQKRRAEGAFTDSPFLSPVRVFELPVAPAFLGAGDFDADGDQDVVAAARGDEALYLLPGDGQGGFGPAQVTELSGTITALAVGEINRRDGLADLVVGISDEAGAQVLVFESPRGAWDTEPERFPLPAGARALALGQLDEHPPLDLAIAAGYEMLIVHGRDRRLWLAAGQRAEVPPATVDRTSFPFPITALASGDFLWEQEYRLELALLSEDGTVHLLQREGLKGGAWELASSLSVALAPQLPRSRAPRHSAGLQSPDR